MMDRSTPAARADGHVLECAERGPQSYCRGCYGSRGDDAPVFPERRPRTMDAAYAALPPKARALMARRKR